MARFISFLLIRAIKWEIAVKVLKCIFGIIHGSAQWAGGKMQEPYKRVSASIEH